MNYAIALTFGAIAGLSAAIATQNYKVEIPFNGTNKVVLDHGQQVTLANMRGTIYVVSSGNSE